MSYLARPDLNRIPIETDSFLGRALVLGRQFERLPEYLVDALMAYLRAQGLAFAHRYRTGIAIVRERLEKGMRQALTCLDLGLEDAAGGDLNAAVDLLAAADLETLRRRGWEIALTRLTRMQEQSCAWRPQQEAIFVQDQVQDLERWARLVPETWTTEEDNEPVDPRQEYAAFRQVEGRLRFLHSLPARSLDALVQAAPEQATFEGVLRQLVLVLALDLDRLAVRPADVTRFQNRCFASGRIRPEVRKKVLGAIAGQLEQAVEDAEARAAILAEAETVIGRLEEEPWPSTRPDRRRARG